MDSSNLLPRGLSGLCYQCLGTGVMELTVLTAFNNARRTNQPLVMRLIGRSLSEPCCFIDTLGFSGIFSVFHVKAIYRYNFSFRESGGQLRVLSVFPSDPGHCLAHDVFFVFHTCRWPLVQHLYIFFVCFSGSTSRHSSQVEAYLNT